MTKKQYLIPTSKEYHVLPLVLGDTSNITGGGLGDEGDEGSARSFETGTTDLWSTPSDDQQDDNTTTGW